MIEGNYSNQLCASEYQAKQVALGQVVMPNALGNRRAAFGASELTDGLAGKT